MKIFSEQLNLIQTPEVRSKVEEALSEIPEVFFFKPASSSGKYHPVECRGEGGLVTHTKYAVNTFMQLYRAQALEYPIFYIDCAIGALILHDGMKYGVDGELTHTTNEHPMLMAEYLYNKAIKFNFKSDDFDAWSCMSSLIKTHHGIWGDVQPATNLAWLVHYADLIASKLDVIKEI